MAFGLGFDPVFYALLLGSSGATEQKTLFRISWVRRMPERPCSSKPGGRKSLKGSANSPMRER